MRPSEYRGLRLLERGAEVCHLPVLIRYTFVWLACRYVFNEVCEPAPRARRRRRADGDRLAEDGHRAGGDARLDTRCAPRRSARAPSRSFRAWRPDVVLIDLVLPDIDGIALLRQLKAIDESPGDDRDQRRRHDHARARSRAGRRVLLHREIESRSRRHRVDPRSRDRSAGRARAARAPEGAGARSIRLLEHHRQEQEDARALRADRGGGRKRRQHPDPGRERRRQGVDRQRDSRPQRPRQGAVHQDQLRGAAEGADRVGAVRLQEGRVHGRDQRQGRACSSWPPAAR